MGGTVGQGLHLGSEVSLDGRVQVPVLDRSGGSDVHRGRDRSVEKGWSAGRKRVAAKGSCGGMGINVVRA